jgi:hypothetical protein
MVSLVVVSVIALGGATIYVVHARAQHAELVRNSAKVDQTDVSEVRDQPRIVFRNTALGSQYGKVAMVPLKDPAGPRAITDVSCDRVHAAAEKVLCLSSRKGVVTTYSAHILDKELKNSQNLPLTGIPSRARISRDGSLTATTSFTAGDSYASTAFSTRTVIGRMADKHLVSLEDFRLVHQGKVIKPIDRNFWGVTFLDDNTFYATVEWARHTWLVKGDIARRQVGTLHDDAECPSVSPDGKLVVYKQHAGRPAGQWQLVLYDTVSGQVTPLAETRSVDDQVEWLDDQHVIYGIPRTGSEAAIDDIWSVPVRGTGKPGLLISQAWSPAVVR